MFKQVAYNAVLFATLAIAAAAQPNQFTGGIHNSSGAYRLNEKQLRMVCDSLRQKSGFVELSFDQDGALTLGNREHIAGGSATARALLVKAVDSADRYELESHDSSPEVAFGRNFGGVLKDSKTAKMMELHLIQLDFADFGQLSGARAAKAAMDLGLTLLHELVHAVLGLQDPQGEMNEIGDCDALVNQMRRELGLAERLYYHPNITVVEFSNRRFVCAKLVFVERAAAGEKPRAQYALSWIAGNVSPNARNIAGLEQGLLAARRR